MSELEEIASRIRSCTLCDLCLERTNAVPGEGPETAEIMLIGEGPGAQEDQQGRPFVGVSGRFMMETLAGAGIRREDVFISNVVKCRPPGNRDPLPDEISICGETYLGVQIELLNPKIIITLGRFSLARFLPNVTISRVHGKPHRVGNRLIYPMLHPAAALRRPEWREAFIEDARRLPDVLAEFKRGLLQANVPAEPETTTPASEAESGDDLAQLSLF